MNLFSKDEDLRKSAPYAGMKILQLISSKENKQISIFDVALSFKDVDNLSVRSVYYGMLFLYSIEAIEFEEPYIRAKC